MRLKNKLAGAFALLVPMSVSAQTVGVGYQASPTYGTIEAAPEAQADGVATYEGLGAAPSEETLKLGLAGTVAGTVDDLTQSQLRFERASRPMSAAVAHSALTDTRRGTSLSVIRDRKVQGDTAQLSGALGRYMDSSRALGAAPETSVEQTESLNSPLSSSLGRRTAFAVNGLSNASVQATGAQGGLWSRFWTAIRSFLGFGVRSMENPELILRQTMDDMKVHGKAMQEAVVEVEKTAILLKGQIDEHTKEIAEMDGNIQAAVKLGPAYEEHAKQIIAAMETAQKSLEDTQAQYDMQKGALKRAKDARDQYKAKMEQRAREAMALIAKDKQAKANDALADVMGDAFNTGDGTSDTFDRMKEKVNERAAKAEARMRNTTTEADDKMAEIKKATAQIGVEEKLAKYKAQMGKGVAAASDASVKGTGAAGGLWSRFWTAIKSYLGWGVRKMENPELVLRQTMDDMKLHGKAMQEAVVEVEKTAILLKGQIDEHTKEIAEMDAQIKAAINLGPSYEEHAKQIIAAMETAQKSLEDTQAQYDMQLGALKRAKDARDQYKAKMEQRAREAMALIAKDKQAKANDALADVMGDAFNTGDGTSDTFDRMKEKVNERAAKAEARMRNTTTDADDKMAEIKKATAKIGVEDKLAEYKRKAGLSGGETPKP